VSRVDAREDQAGGGVALHSIGVGRASGQRQNAQQEAGR
jgi:hypothetical protein